MQRTGWRRPSRSGARTTRRGSASSTSRLFARHHILKTRFPGTGPGQPAKRSPYERSGGAAEEHDKRPQGSLHQYSDAFIQAHLNENYVFFDLARAPQVAVEAPATRTPNCAEGTQQERVELERRRSKAKEWNAGLKAACAP